VPADTRAPAPSVATLAMADAQARSGDAGAAAGSGSGALSKLAPANLRPRPEIRTNGLKIESRVPIGGATGAPDGRRLGRNARSRASSDGARALAAAAGPVRAAGRVSR
jgi:hypothetical protein